MSASAFPEVQPLGKWLGTAKIISESGLYKLVMSSDKPEAKRSFHTASRRSPVSDRRYSAGGSRPDYENTVDTHEFNVPAAERIFIDGRNPVRV